jgi:hypothetical protein
MMPFIASQVVLVSGGWPNALSACPVAKSAFLFAPSAAETGFQFGMSSPSAIIIGSASGDLLVLRSKYLRVLQPRVFQCFQCQVSNTSSAFLSPAALRRGLREAVQ